MVNPKSPRKKKKCWPNHIQIKPSLARLMAHNFTTITVQRYIYFEPNFCSRVWARKKKTYSPTIQILNPVDSSFFVCLPGLRPFVDRTRSPKSFRLRDSFVFAAMLCLFMIISMAPDAARIIRQTQMQSHSELDSPRSHCGIARENARVVVFDVPWIRLACPRRFGQNLLSDPTLPQPQSMLMVDVNIIGH